MEYVKLDHVFNYISPAIRQMFSDDEQFKSWALSAYRTLNDWRTRYVKDIYFADVVNHKAPLPPGRKRIISVRKFSDTYTSGEAFSELCQTELPNYDSFASPCPISAKYFLESNFYLNFWIPVIWAGNLEDNYLCRVQNESCNFVYSTKPGSETATFDFCEGTVVYEYYKNATDDSGNFLLPREPEVLWYYLGAFCSYKFWSFQYDLSKDGAMQKRREYQQEMANLRGDAKAALMFGGISLYLNRHITFDEMRIGKLPSFQQRLQNWRANV